MHARYDVELEWEPFELRPGAPETGWAVPEHVRAKLGRPDNPLTQRARSLGITLAEREWVPSSRRAHECTEHARSAGKLARFHAAVLASYWSEGKDLHDWDVLAAAAASAGLDAAAMRAEVEAGAWTAQVDARIAAANEIGIHAVPTFVLGDRFVVQGAQTLDVFESVLAKLGVSPR